MEIKKTVCPLDCPDTCGIIVHLENGIITKLDGDPDHPFTKGFICRKMRQYHHRVQCEQRILYPQKRIGKKGEGRFQQISWDEAWDIMTKKLAAIKDQFGGEALLPYSYAGNMGKINRWAGYPFFHKYGASQLMNTICSAAADSGWTTHYGNLPTCSPMKAKDAKLIIAWGINIKVTNIHFMPLITAAKKKGAKFVVIDPYRNITADAADYYYPVHPGGDTALALGILKYLADQNHLDMEFIAQYSQGFDKLAAYLHDHSLNYFARESGLNKEQIIEIAHLTAQNPQTFIRLGYGLSRNTQGAMAVRAISCLAAAVGLFEGGKGRGAMIDSKRFSGDNNKLHYQSYLENATRKINMVQVADALTKLEPPIKALFVYSSNPLSVAPDARLLRQGLSREDLFTIVHEQILTPTVRYADLLLPATTSFENSDIYGAYGQFCFTRVKPVIPPRGEAISNFDLFQNLANKMGYTEDAFQQSIDDRINDYVSSMKGLADEVQQHGLQPGIHAVSQWEKIGGDFSKLNGAKFQFSNTNSNNSSAIIEIPMVIPRQEFQDIELAKKYPFMLITPPISSLLNSSFGELYQDKIGEVLIHPNDAANLNIKNGVKIELYNHRGRNQRLAKISERTQPGLLVAEGIFWENQQSDYTGINDLTSQATTDLGEGSTFHESRVNIM